MSDYHQRAMACLGDDLRRIAEQEQVLVSIVRDLAAEDEENVMDECYCQHCGVLTRERRSGQEHAETCVWRRAVEWVAANGGTGG